MSQLKAEVPLEGDLCRHEPDLNQGAFSADLRKALGVEQKHEERINKALVEGHGLVKRREQLRKTTS